MNRVAAGAVVLVWVVACSGPVKPPSKAQPVDLSGQDWDYRLLLLFAPSAEDAELRLQKQFLAGDEADLQAADIMPIEVLGEGPIRLGPPGGTSIEAEQLRERFGVFEELFTVILVGKDGRVRIRSTDPLTSREILAAVESIPSERVTVREPTEIDLPR